MSDSPDPARVPRVPAAPDFTPVPVRARKDGWTPERQRRFIAVLRRGRSVGAAARAVGMSRESAYRLRERPGAESFAAAWDAVQASRPAPVETNLSQLWYRAFYGKVKPIIRKGEQVGTSHQPDNDALLRLYDRVERNCRNYDRWAQGRRNRGRSQ
ncbi:MAG TPA: hypothetical protein VMS43_01760 [Allosphingosinicella sp.]|nr:hypothetical protein [Allosphingosinicella sp.]